MVVYADILYLINGIFDFVCLAVCRRIRALPRKTGRMLLAAAMGGLYGAAAGCIALPSAVVYAASAIMACVMCAIAFGRQPVLPFVRTVLLFYVANMLLGGLLTLMQSVIWRMPDGINGTSLLLYGLLFALLLAVMEGIGALLHASRTKREAVVTVSLGQTSASFGTLADSGNLLRDPFAGVPVILLSSAALQRAFPKEAALFTPEAVPPPQLAYGWHIIPASTASGHTLLTVIVPDTVCVNGARVKAVIAAAPAGNYGGTEGLVPADLLP